MQDDNNTFSIPQADPANNTTPPSGQPVSDAANNQLGFTPAPAPVASNPLETTAQPQWVDQSVGDAATLNDQGANNYSVSTPTPTNPLTAPVAQPEMQMPVPGQTPMAPATQPVAQANPLEAPALQQPVAPEPMPAAPAEVPSSNTLDLSNAQPPVSSAPVQGFNQNPGVMQPGVDIAPVATADYDPSTGGIPNDFGAASFNTDITNMADMQESSSKKPLKFIIIGVVALALVLILGLVLVLVSRNDRAPAVELNQEQVEDTTTATATTPAAIPDGFKQATRDCYSFGVMTPTTLNFSNTACNIKAKFGSVSQYDMSVTPVTDNVPDLQALVDLAKQGNITSQEDITLNGIAAKKVIQSVNGLDVQTIVVMPTDKNYQFNSKTVNGFIINSSFNDDTAKSASSTLVSTWSWK